MVAPGRQSLHSSCYAAVVQRMAGPHDRPATGTPDHPRHTPVAVRRIGRLENNKTVSSVSDPY